MIISRVVLRTQPDERLARLAASGSEAAFETIVRRYRRPLLAYCRRRLRSESRGEDAVQQTFLAAWTALRNGTEVRDLRPWLYRIAHNQAASMLRQPGRDDAMLDETMRGADAPEDELESRLLMRATLAATAALPDLQREAILRTALAGESYEQVAAALGVTDGAVRGLVHRARVSLRRGVAAVAPAPLVAWAAGHGRRAGPLAQRLADALVGAGVGAGSAGGAVAVLKGAAVIATSAAVVGGSAPRQRPEARPAPAVARVSPRRGVATADVSALGLAGIGPDPLVTLVHRSFTGFRQPPGPSHGRPAGHAGPKFHRYLAGWRLTPGARRYGVCAGLREGTRVARVPQLHQEGGGVQKQVLDPVAARELDGGRGPPRRRGRDVLAGAGPDRRFHVHAAAGERDQDV